MEEIGRRGTCVWLKFDPFRERNKYTIIAHGVRIADTDDPIAYIVKTLREGEKLASNKKA